MWLENAKKEAADAEEQQIHSENLQTFNLIMKLLVFLKASQPKGQDIFGSKQYTVCEVL